MPIFLEEERQIKIPKLRKVKTDFDKTHITDVKATTKAEVSRELTRAGVGSNMKIAVAVGSRGIGNLLDIIETVIEEIKKTGAEPFIVGAMGSHGAGTEEGQKEILESLGITSERLGVEIVTREDTIQIGSLSTGEGIFFSKAAYEADGLILVNRVKPHTDFDGKGKMESGLCKMSVIGLGNHKGCVSMHRCGLERFPDVLIEASCQIFEKSPILFGVAIVENAYGKPYLIEAIPKEKIPERELQLLALSKEKMAKLPFPEIDILVIEKIGKDISGSGADPNVIGRLGPKKDASYVPDIKCIIILGLTEQSHGNATGIGFADVITRNAFEQIDLETTYANCLAGGSKFGIACARIPIIMETEEDAMLAAFKICGKAPEESRIVRIKNTKELETYETN